MNKDVLCFGVVCTLVGAWWAASLGVMLAYGSHVHQNFTPLVIGMVLISLQFFSSLMIFFLELAKRGGYGSEVQAEPPVPESAPVDSAAARPAPRPKCPDCSWGQVCEIFLWVLCAGPAVGLFVGPLFYLRLLSAASTEWIIIFSVLSIESILICLVIAGGILAIIGVGLYACLNAGCNAAPGCLRALCHGCRRECCCRDSFHDPLVPSEPSPNVAMTAV